MLILAADASGPAAGIALARDDTPLYAQTLLAGKGHAAQLMPMAEAACVALDLTPGGIDLFAAVVGPGSFTGVRIGVASVQGMAIAAGNKPCVAINALEALAAGVANEQGVVVCPILDARAGQVYTAAFECGKRVWPDLAERVDILLPRWQALARPLLFTGDGVAVHRAQIARALGEQARFASAHLAVLNPAAAAFLAWRDRALAVEVQNLRPLYLRAPQAERERLARLGAQGTSHET